MKSLKLGARDLFIAKNASAANREDQSFVISEKEKRETFQASSSVNNIVISPKSQVNEQKNK